MILRRPARGTGQHPDAEPHPAGADRSFLRRASLRVRLVAVTAAMVAVAVIMMLVVAYWTLSTSLSESVDRALDDKASSFLQNTLDPKYVFDPEQQVQMFRTYNPDIRVAFYPPGSVTPIGDSIPLRSEVDVLHGTAQTTVRNLGDQRILAKRSPNGTTVILSQNMAATHQLIRSLGFMLMLVGLIGILVAIASGMVVASTGLRPVARLQRALDYVARTDDLSPIEVVGNDEVARVTRSFNNMLEALQASRRRQTELVADAGHELKTPLTSLRTNIELLMMVSRGGGPGLSEDDRHDLERDVIAQIEELSQLIGDLVDLAREDGKQSQATIAEVDLAECIETALERVRRRRTDVAFEFRAEPWYLCGDGFALGRAMLNLMDNAAKWSPPEGTVRIEMTRVALDLMEITVADSGPGIPVEDREKVFERFYRSIQARSMTGSGLGLAIVHQVILRHQGTIVAEESDDGGCLMRVTLPGSPSPGVVDSESCPAA